jgi:hypothetical protein
MAQVLIPSLIGALTGTFAVGSTFAGLAITGFWGSVAANLAVNIAAGYALNALAPKAKAGAAGAGYASVNALSPAAATNIIYGATRVGGITFYQETTNNNKFLHKLVAVAGHEVNAIGDIYLNDELVTLDEDNYVTAPSSYITYSKDRTDAGSFVVGKTYKIANTGGGGDEPNPTDFVAIGAANNNVDTVFTATGAGSGNGSAYLRTSRVRLIKHLGTADQAADADLVSESLLWTSNHRARGIAYIYARFEYSADAFPNGVPVITTVVQGKKVYDPRTETTAYSSNAALCLRDYLISSGVAFTSEIDDTLFSTAANICDETVTLDAGGEHSITLHNKWYIHQRSCPKGCSKQPINIYGWDALVQPR